MEMKNNKRNENEKSIIKVKRIKVFDNSDNDNDSDSDDYSDNDLCDCEHCIVVDKKHGGGCCFNANGGIYEQITPNTFDHDKIKKCSYGCRIRAYKLDRKFLSRLMMSFVIDYNTHAINEKKYLNMLREVANVDNMARVNSNLVINWAIRQGVSADNIRDFINCGFYYNPSDVEFCSYLIDQCVIHKKKWDKKEKLYKENGKGILDRPKHWVNTLLDKDIVLSNFFVSKVVFDNTNIEWVNYN